GAGSLRQAITDANASNGLDTIEFNITDPASGVRTITPATEFDPISSPVIMDGYTQPGTSSNTLANADNAVLLIEITGANPNFSSGNANNINGHGIEDSDVNDVIQGNFIGVDATGTNALPNGVVGVRIDFGGIGNLIGGTNAGARNIISGNGSEGIEIVSGAA